MDVALRSLLKNLSNGVVESLDRSFSVDRENAHRNGAVGDASEAGLVALAKAVGEGCPRMDVWGDDHGCSIHFGENVVHGGQGVLSRLVSRGSLASLELRVNDRLVKMARTNVLASTTLGTTTELTGGLIDLLPAQVPGELILVDRGVAFRLGRVFRAVRVVAYVGKLDGAPWPTHLILDQRLRLILRDVLQEVELAEIRFAQTAKARGPNAQLLTRRLLWAASDYYQRGEIAKATRLLQVLYPRLNLWPG